MDRRSGLKKAHFSSVPTRMSLFTCKKYVFLIKKTFPPPPPPKNRENSAQRFPMGRVGKLNTTLFMNRVVGWELSFTEDFVVIPTIDLEIQLFVGKVMIKRCLLSFH
ncbi:hypothetical protein LEP1GSC116_2922 [Leptospira interrogans serovar Icterohaemorrhagiae str. Verdun HP]|uniref:Uncharacterized protein n=2 Tax=Leptospira interrogans TaxID=173 RepID=M6RES9_LEPIR|nr:hypothetical protein LEP1GSC150_4339 [Leptospira interrogans serovar Copenhageni str. LT2050]EMO04256.1 hypothetical protein LEP1GSC116_2922 [Leptospira interrogans serovar Icterohaemorrhagiae str. Verdun HP]QIP62902.1 hypothetical protein LICSK_02795 [Leptospira interrogans serovar Copenhageni]